MLYSLQFEIGVHLLNVELSQLLTPGGSEKVRNSSDVIYGWLPRAIMAVDMIVPSKA